MQFNTQVAKALASLKTAALFVGVYAGGQLSAAAAEVDAATQGSVKKVVKAEGLGAAGKTVVLHAPSGMKAERVVLVGLGEKKELSLDTLLRAHESMASFAKDVKAKEVVSTLLQELPAEPAAKAVAQHVARAVHNAGYVYSETFSKANKPAETTLSKVVFLLSKGQPKAEMEAGLNVGYAIAEGQRFCRYLGDLPANMCNPTQLSEKAKALVKGHKLAKAEVLHRKQIEALGMGAYLSVSAGSDQEPRFIVLKYYGKTKKTSGEPKHPIVLVGKGVTFDSGGISLKPGAGMQDMKYDMGGAASVLGTFKAALEMQLPLDLVVIVAATENMPSGKATKPSDVVTAMDGTTIVVENTDAEGRLTLCDALLYGKQFKPKAIIDVATLTGACVVALGYVRAGLYSNQEALGEALFKAGEASRDLAWRMPLDKDYYEMMKSKFADLSNMAAPGGGGSITAAAFLSHFTKDVHWAHLDIAGVAWSKMSAGMASGRPVPLLCEYLLEQVK